MRTPQPWPVSFGSFASLALVAACGGAPPPPPAPPAPPPSTATTTAATGSGSAAVAVAATAVTSTDAYKQANEALLVQFGAILQLPDCDQAAAALTSFVDQNRDMLFSIRAWEKAHPDDEHAFDTSHQDVEKRTLDLFATCHGNPAFLAAVRRFPS